MGFRPTLWPTLFTVPALILLIGLGTWQLERREWKEALIATRQTRSSAAPVALPPDGVDPAGYEYRKTRVTGRFRHDKEMFLAARSLNGNVGYHVVTPLIAEDGRAVLIDRGWIPDDRKEAATRAAGESDGLVSVEGLLRASQQKAWLVPENEPQRDLWFYVDVPAMARWAGVDQVPSYFVEAGPAPNPGGYPIGGQSRLDLPNNHLQYAFTWYSFAASLAVIYVLYHRKLAREQAQEAQEGREGRAKTGTEA